MTIKGTELVEKRNILNEVRRNSMTLQELRFFSIYLSKINARDISTRKITFPLADFQKIMELGRMNINHLQAITNSLLSKVVSIRLEDGGYESFQLFKHCKVYRNELNEWFIDIDAHDNALPLMFDFKDRYFTYELWNALRLKSGNQLRMYEILKQYEGVGERKIPIAQLRELLGIAPEEYPRWDNFKRRVLDSCREALAENTDICFDYEQIKSGRKITGLRFIIKKNPNYVEPLSLAEFIDAKTLSKSASESVEDKRYNRTEICFGFEDEIFDEFSNDQLKELREIAWRKVEQSEIDMYKSILGDTKYAKEFAVAAYIRSKILMCNAKGSSVNHRYTFIKRAVDENWN